MRWREAAELGCWVTSVVLGLMAALSCGLGWGVCPSARRLCRGGLLHGNVTGLLTLGRLSQAASAGGLEGPVWAGASVVACALGCLLLGLSSWLGKRCRLSEAAVYLLPNASLALRFQAGSCGGFLALFYGLGGFRLRSGERLDMAGWLLAGVALAVVAAAALLEFLLDWLPEGQLDPVGPAVTTPISNTDTYFLEEPRRGTSTTQLSTSHGSALTQHSDQGTQDVTQLSQLDDVTGISDQEADQQSTQLLSSSQSSLSTSPTAF